MIPEFSLVSPTAESIEKQPLWCVWTDEDLVELDLSEEENQQMSEIGNEFNDVLAKYAHLFEGFGRCRIAKHHIPLLDDTVPIIIPERRFPAPLMEMARTQIKELLEADIIRPSHSE